MLVQTRSRALWGADTRLRCGKKFQRCIQDYDPDLVVSLHRYASICRYATRTRCNETVGAYPSRRCARLGGAHPSWFVKGVDACFVPSDAVHRIVERRGVDASKIRQHGLPVT